MMFIADLLLVGWWFGLERESIRFDSLIELIDFYAIIKIIHFEWLFRK